MSKTPGQGQATVKYMLLISQFVRYHKAKMIIEVHNGQTRKFIIAKILSSVPFRSMLQYAQQNWC